MRTTLTIAVVAILAGSPRVGAPECGDPTVTSRSADQRARALVARMTLDQKIAQVHGEPTPDDFRIVPGIPALGIPALTVTNGPAGVGPGPQPLGNVPATALPSPLLLAATWDPAMARRYGDVQGREMRAVGRNLLEAPDVDIARVPRNGRTFEAYGEDPHLASRLAVENIRAIQSHGILAMAKHHVVNNQERDRATVDVQVDERTLRELYLPPFEAAVREARVASVMCSYNRVNGPYSCEHGALLSDVLKAEWQFEGFVQSDFFATHSTVGSANAGMDLEMPTGQYFGDALRAAVRAGEVPEARLDDMLIRRYRQMLRFGLFDRAPRTSPIQADAHAAIARELGAGGTVLLRNQGGLLPLRAGAIRRLAVLGPWSTKAATGGGGSSMVNPVRQVTPREAIGRRQVAELLTDDGVDPDTAAAFARAADVAVVVVGDFESEGTDRSSLSLPGGQDALVAAVAAANPRTVVVLHAGAPVLMPWRDQVAAILAGWYPGGEDGEITAAVLFGEREPAGRLPITFPASETDGPANTPRRYPGVGGKVWYEEGLLVGHRWYDATGAQPLFPFGFGLSYTTFRIDGLQVSPRRSGARETVRVRVRVKNTGTRAGAEVVQLYVAYPVGLGEPPKQLRAFRKVRLRPGHARTTTLRLPPRAFALWDTPAGRWRVRAGTYHVLAGTSSADTPLVAAVERAAGTLPR